MRAAPFASLDARRVCLPALRAVARRPALRFGLGRTVGRKARPNARQRTCCPQLTPRRLWRAVRVLSLLAGRTTSLSEFSGPLTYGNKGRRGQGPGIVPTGASVRSPHPDRQRDVGWARLTASGFVCFTLGCGGDQEARSFPSLLEDGKSFSSLSLVAQQTHSSSRLVGSASFPQSCGSWWSQLRSSLRFVQRERRYFGHS